MSNSSIIINVPRGKQGLPRIPVDMSRVYEAENRLHEIAFVTPATSRELSSYFNQACNETAKYLAWVEYEILQANKTFDICRAKVILDKAPVEAAKLKEVGGKPNEDWRDALVTMDVECQVALDTVNNLKAIKALLESKVKTFERAYFSAKLNSDEKDRIGASPNLTGTIGQLSDPQDNFMGQTQTRRM